MGFYVMIISEKQIFQLMCLVESVLDDDMGMKWRTKARELLNNINDQQSSELKEIE